ncbi:MAG: ABC transporter ATP-binding protein [Burkholderiales bacterium]|nr:ABC transporter ATP-binding protein [Anaerolineae bacterium]
MALLEVRNLSVVYHTQRGQSRAVDNVSLTVEQAQHLGVIGESGCGKSTLLRALVRVLPRNGQIVSGEILFKGRDLLKLSANEMRQLRWREIATVPQASMDSLDPVQRVGGQLEKILTVRGGLDRRTAKRRSVELFDLVGLDSKRLTHYPHEFSGGMKQRAIIAMALALSPSLLIADEPLTALDVIVQHQVLEVFKRLEDELNLTVMLATHDISVVAQVCDSVAVMYAGRVVERADVSGFFNTPYHPYSLGLQQAFPNIVRPKDMLVSIEGYPPDLHEPPSACRFAPRCPFVQQKCREIDPPLVQVDAGQEAACLRADEMDTLRAQGLDPHVWQTTEVAVQMLAATAAKSDTNGAHQPSPATLDGGDLLQVQGVSKRYHVGGGLAGLLRGTPAQTVYAVNGLSFTLRRGESLGLAGESGSGKTTTGKLLIKMLEPSVGSILFDGSDLTQLTGDGLKSFRRRAQLMFQNPFEALNPRFTLYRSLSEPLLIHGWKDEDKRLARILETLGQVNLRPPEAFLDKYPHQLSGGQLQRVVLARALVLRPDFLVADEPVSMLDVSVRAGILNTMKDLARDMGLTTVYISHDLSLLQYTCDRIAVMYLGHIVEVGPAQEIIQNPKHPYTKALIAAVPVPDPAIKNLALPIREGVPRPTQLAQGCPFLERCPEAMEACINIFPPSVEVGENQFALCHLYGEHANSPKISAEFRVLSSE